MKTLRALVAIALVAFISMFAFSNEAHPLATAGVLFVGVALLTSMLPAKYAEGTLNAGINVEVWKKYIIEKFRRNHNFLMKSKDDSGYVLGGSVVHIAQAGADPAVVKNRNTYPAVAVRRTDTDITYPLDSYTTDPMHIPFDETQTIAYDKIDSVLGSHVDTLTEVVASDMITRWAPATTGVQSIATTGGATAITQAGEDGQTTTRKILHPDDVRKVMTTMDKQDVPRTGRVMLIDPVMYGPLYDQLTQNQAAAFLNAANLQEGIVGRLHGFDIMVRSLVANYTTGGAIKAFDSALAATDNRASLAWHPNVVCRAVGSIKKFQDKDNPLYYGDIFSMYVRMGGRQERTDGKGIFAVVQSA